MEFSVLGLVCIEKTQPWSIVFCTVYFKEDLGI